LTERILDRGGGVGDQDHVRFLDLLETPDRGAVETVPVLEGVGRQVGRRDGEVLDLARQVTETQIDELEAFVGDLLQDFLRCGHVFPLCGASAALNSGSISRWLSDCYGCVSAGSGCRAGAGQWSIDLESGRRRPSAEDSARSPSSSSRRSARATTR